MNLLCIAMAFKGLNKGYFIHFVPWNRTKAFAPEKVMRKERFLLKNLKPLLGFLQQCTLNFKAQNWYTWACLDKVTKQMYFVSVFYNCRSFGHIKFL